MKDDMIYRFVLISAGEAASETVAQGSNMVVQDKPKGLWKPHARLGVEEHAIRQGNGALAQKQDLCVSCHVGSMRPLP